MRELKKQKLDQMLTMGFNELGLTELALLAVFTLKKDGIIGFCIDFQKLNAVKIPYSYLVSHGKYVFTWQVGWRYFRHWTRTAEVGV